jgi:hypothetical protein
MRVAAVEVAFIAVVALLRLGRHAIAAGIPDAVVHHAVQVSASLTADSSVLGAIALGDALWPGVVIARDRGHAL